MDIGRTSHTSRQPQIRPEVRRRCASQCVCLSSLGTRDQQVSDTAEIPPRNLFENLEKVRTRTAHACVRLTDWR